MKSKYVTVVICMSFMAVLFLSGFVSKVQAEEGRTAVKQGYHEKEEFKQQAKERLAEFDRKINELEVKAKETGSKTKAEVKKGLRELKTKRAALKKNMERLEASSERTWEAAKQKVNMAMDDLERTYDKVRNYFR
jgi:peptidoglycan hydrolase CwlO-like protein